MSDPTAGPFARLKRPLLYLMSAAYVLAGVAHLLAPEPFERIVPRELPRPRLLVTLSGVAEIGLGIGVLIPRTRPAAAKGIVLLLAAVFPANVNMAVRDLDLAAVDDVPDAALWARLPLQAVLAAWAWWYTTPLPERAE
ncbi:DoxX family protein [Halobaculum lipolyticum]|uniref:DoxX family membrane protein n=1 Tax=Halobaculum lipolyticum TaxID=3032001 RepID=A0ABD5WD25_9EURY|nr:hypothetical protein [Halobaculum sp. DT31]